MNYYSSSSEDSFFSSVGTIKLGNDPSIQSLLDSNSGTKKKKVRITMSFQNIWSAARMGAKTKTRSKSESSKRTQEALRKPLPYKPRRQTEKKSVSIESIPSSSEETDEMASIPSICSIEKLSNKLEMMKDKLQTSFKFFSPQETPNSLH